MPRSAETQDWTLAKRLRRLRATVRVRFFRRLRTKLTGSRNYWTLNEAFDYFGITRSKSGYDEHGVFLGEGHQQQLEDEHAAAERQRRLERAAEAIERGELDLPSPEELAALRRVVAVGGWHERLRGTFKGGPDSGGRWWIWHNGLAIYGEGESYETARADLLEEVADAIDEWRQLADA